MSLQLSDKATIPKPLFVKKPADFSGRCTVLVRLVSNTCTAREQHLHGSRATLARLASDTCVVQARCLLLVFRGKRELKNAFRLPEKRFLWRAVYPLPLAGEEHRTAVASCWPGLEELRFLSQYVAQQQVG